MSRTTAKAHHTLSNQLASGAVETELGIIRECTVAKSGVPLKGHSVMLDKNGGLTKDEKLCVKKLPIFTDEKTLATLMTAAAAASKRLKVREDHDDSVGARAGFADAFKLTTDGRVVADLHIFDSYRHRGVVLETAAKTPEEIGLSIDFTPIFELAGDHALMRVEKLHAVDIVDEGAITPGGLLLSAGVDSGAKDKSAAPAATETPPTMAEPTNTEIMTALGALTKSVAECQAAIGKMATPPPPPAEVKGDEELKALKASTEKLATGLGEVTTQLKAVVADNAKLKREKALLGFPGTAADRAALASASAEDIEKLSGERKSYLQLVADARAKDSKLSAGDAHAFVRKSTEGATAYAVHLSAKGVTGRMVA